MAVNLRNDMTCTLISDTVRNVFAARVMALAMTLKAVFVTHARLCRNFIEGVSAALWTWL